MHRAMKIIKPCNHVVEFELRSNCSHQIEVIFPLAYYHRLLPSRSCYFRHVASLSGGPDLSAFYRRRRGPTDPFNRRSNQPRKAGARRTGTGCCCGQGSSTVSAANQSSRVNAKGSINRIVAVLPQAPDHENCCLGLWLWTKNHVGPCGLWGSEQSQRTTSMPQSSRLESTKISPPRSWSRCT